MNSMKTIRPCALLDVILLLYTLLATLFALYTPPWQAPDEPADYNYVRILAENGSFPVLHEGDYPHAYLEEIKAARFPGDMSITPIRYESHQPPLYYVLAAPIYTLTAGRLLPLRLFSVVLGAGIVLLTYAIGRRVCPGRPSLALAAAAFVAFLPQHLATVSQVGNDVLAEVLVAAVLYVLIAGMGDGRPLASSTAGLGTGVSERTPNPKSQIPNPQSPIILGLLLGLILITKTTAYVMVPLVAGTLIWGWWRGRAGMRRVMAEGLAALLPAALIALPWYARNLWVYGWPDFLGLIRHDAIVAGQTRTLEFISQNGWLVYGGRAVEWTFKSFWGIFGWMGAWLDSRVYFALAVLSGVVVGGGVLGMRYWGLRTAVNPKIINT